VIFLSPRATRLIFTFTFSTEKDISWAANISTGGLPHCSTGVSVMSSGDNTEKEYLEELKDKEMIVLELLMKYPDGLGLNEMAKMLEGVMSRNTLRDVLDRLVKKGLVVVPENWRQGQKKIYRAAEVVKALEDVKASIGRIEAKIKEAIDLYLEAVEHLLKSLCSQQQCSEEEKMGLLMQLDYTFGGVILGPPLILLALVTVLPSERAARLYIASEVNRAITRILDYLYDKLHHSSVEYTIVQQREALLEILRIGENLLEERVIKKLKEYRENPLGLLQLLQSMSSQSSEKSSEKNS